MLSLRQIRRRIKSVEGTKKITHAMEMVAAAKLKRLQGTLAQSSRYVGELKRILEVLAASRGGVSPPESRARQPRPYKIDHPLIKKREEITSSLFR